MASRLYVGSSGKARKVSNLYVGVSNKARRVKRAWVGVNGVAQLCYMNIPSTIGLNAGAYESIRFTHNGETKTVTTNGNGYVETTIYLTEESATITFTALTSGFTRTVTINAGESVYGIAVRPARFAVWYGIQGSYGLDLWTVGGTRTKAEITSDNQILLSTDYFDDVAGISLRDSFPTTPAYHIYLQGTTNDSSSDLYLRWGNTTYKHPDPRDTSDWTSQSRLILSSNTFSKVRDGDGSTYAAVCVYQKSGSSPDLPLWSDVYIKGFGID